VTSVLSFPFCFSWATKCVSSFKYDKLSLGDKLSLDGEDSVELCLSDSCSSEFRMNPPTNNAFFHGFKIVYVANKAIVCFSVYYFL